MCVSYIKLSMVLSKLLGPGLIVLPLNYFILDFMLPMITPTSSFSFIPLILCIYCFYVDDIIITDNNSSFIIEIVSQLGSFFALKDLRCLNYFLRLQIEYIDSGLSVHQSKCAQDLLTKFNMLDCKPCSNPFASNHHFFLTHSPLLTDPIAYRSLVGALQYMTFNRLDLSYAVQQASQFMSKPTQHNFIAAKRILKYLKGFLHMGIHFQLGPLSISTYCDAD